MNIKGLRAFRNVVAQGSAAAAAESMHLSQPAISRLISGLEAELRLTLFHRTRQRLLLTEEGAAFYREAGRILDNLDEVPRIVAEIRAERVERLRIVCMPRIAPTIVSPAVSRMAADHPKVRISLDVRTRRDLERWIAGREYDIGVGALPVSHPQIESRPLFRAAAQVVLPAGHPLAEREALSAKDLKGERIVTLMRGLLLRQQVDEFFRSAGIEAAYAIETASSQLACQLVADGAGLTIADSLTTSVVESARIVLRPLEPRRWTSFGLLIPGKAGPAAYTDRFVETLNRTVAAMLRPGSIESVDPAVQTQDRRRA